MGKLQVPEPHHVLRLGASRCQQGCDEDGLAKHFCHACLSVFGQIDGLLLCCTGRRNADWKRLYLKAKCVK
jgi:hypothetical protein